LVYEVVKRVVLRLNAWLDSSFGHYYTCSWALCRVLWHVTLYHLTLPLRRTISMKQCFM